MKRPEGQRIIIFTTSKIVYFYFFQGAKIVEKSVSNCNRKVSLSCNEKHIAIRKLNTTIDSFAMEMLKCNGREVCEIENPEETCIEMSYWCIEGKLI